MRRWNGELVEYERMKAYYKEQGQEPPYKTLGAFRREVRKPREKQSPAMKTWHRHYADSQQYERWKDVIGAENMPKTLDKFQKMKYNNSKKYEELKGFRDYKKDNPRSQVRDYKTAIKLKKQGVRGSIHIPAQEVDVSDFVFDEQHINIDRKHNIVRKEAESFIQGAIISQTVWNGTVVKFFSPLGATYIDLSKKTIKTSFRSNEFDEKTKNIISEVQDGNAKD